MGNTTDNTTINIAGSVKTNSVRMAYTLNDYQPVQCTMVSDQPFFYMDEDMPMDEEGLFAEELFIEDEAFAEELMDDNIGAELLNFKNKIDAYERVSLDFSKGEDERHQQFLMDSHIFTRGAPEIDACEIISKIKVIIADSRYASMLLAFANKNEIDLEISNQISISAYDKKAGKIFIRGNLDLTDQVLLTVQELRRHWQHHHGALVHPLTFHPDQAVLINRAQMADLSVSIVRSAWELKLSGHNDVWSRIENSSLSDLGRALAREALGDFRTLNNGKALSAVFETWFLSERCRAQDKKLIQSMLADYRGYVFDSAEASRMVSIDLICALGEQPGINGQAGKNYLAAYAQMIMNDSIFTDVRDRSNANFLWFIKFEREFTETEQELQSSNLIKESGIQQADNNDIIEDTNHENAFSDADKEQLRQSIFISPQGESDDNVIHVQFGANTGSRKGISS